MDHKLRYSRSQRSESKPKDQLIIPGTPLGSKTEFCLKFMNEIILSKSILSENFKYDHSKSESCVTMINVFYKLRKKFYTLSHYCHKGKIRKKVILELFG